MFCFICIFCSLVFCNFKSLYLIQISIPFIRRSGAIFSISIFCIFVFDPRLNSTYMQIWDNFFIFYLLYFCIFEFLYLIHVSIPLICRSGTLQLTNRPKADLAARLRICSALYLEYILKSLSENDSLLKIWSHFDQITQLSSVTAIFKINLAATLRICSALSLIYILENQPKS